MRLGASLPVNSNDIYLLFSNKLIINEITSLTRGIRIPPAFSAGFSRITPAYAGNTCVTLSSSIFARDHPRLRGEHIIMLNKM